MGVQNLRGGSDSVDSVKPARITDDNEKQGPSADFEICYAEDAMNKLPLKKPTD
jgi:hypothetical protein